MAQSSDEWITALPRERKILFNFLKQASANPHTRIVDLTFAKMKDVATQNYHPAVRYNAMLVISELNSQEAGSSTPATPYAAALPFMADQLANPDQLESVRIAAAVGVLRHAELMGQGGGADRTAAIAKILPVAADAKAHPWLRSRTIEALAALTQPAPDDNVVKLMAATIGNENEPIGLRLATAAAIGRLDLKGTSVSGKNLARDLGKLAAEASQVLWAKLDAEIKAEKAKPAGGDSLQPNPRRDERIKLVRSALKSYAVDVLRGLQGGERPARISVGAASAPKGDAKYLGDVVTAVQGLSKAADVTKPPMEDLAQSMQTGITAIGRHVVAAGGRVAPLNATPDPAAAPAAAVPASAPAPGETPAPATQAAVGGQGTGAGEVPGAADKAGPTTAAAANKK
jgi:hypothetical protein